MRFKQVFTTLYPLFIVQFFTWLGMFALWIYCTPVVAKYVFSNTENNLDQTTLWVGIYFAFYSTLAAFLAFALQKLTKKINIRIIHSCCLLTGSVGLFLIYFFQNRFLLFISFAFIAVAWSSIANIPYDIVGNIAPEEKLPVYFKVFNFSVVIPQVVAAFLLAWLNKSVFHGESIYVILAGAMSMLIAGIIMFFISKRNLYPSAS